MSLSFEELLQDEGIDIAPDDHHHASDGWVQFDCPFCSEGNQKYHMGYSTDGGFTNCWLCGYHFLRETLTELLTGETTAGINNILHRLDKPTFDGGPTDRRKRTSLVLPKNLEKIGECHYDYLVKRGFDPDEIERLWGIQGITMTTPSSMMWRIFIPIILNGETVSWTTRSISNQVKPSYLSASAEQEAIAHKDLLYAEDYCQHAVIVHEGPLDVWATGPGAVATFGVVMSQAQVLRLSKYPMRVVCFDNEPNAQLRAEELCNALNTFPGETLNVMLETGSDPAEADKSELIELRNFLR